MIFWKRAKGGGVIFNPKIYIADFGNFKQGFLSMRFIKRRVISGFRVCCFNNGIQKNQNKTLFEEGTSESLYYLAIIPPCIYATISLLKNLQKKFPKMRWGGDGRLEFFRKFIRFGTAILPLGIGNT